MKKTKNKQKKIHETRKINERTVAFYDTTGCSIACLVYLDNNVISTIDGCIEMDGWQLHLPVVCYVFFSVIVCSLCVSDFQWYSIHVSSYIETYCILFPDCVLF